jgi:hypothetical protein
MIIAAVEGYPDEEVIKRILNSTGFHDAVVLRKRGKGDLDASLPALNRSARTIRCLVVRDLDHDAVCPLHLRNQLIPNPSPNLHFRVAVREIESWLFGDREKFADFLNVPLSRMPQLPDNVDDPKLLVTQIATRSRDRRIREDVPPRPGSGISVGPGYAGLLGKFAREVWRPEAAAELSPSLRRCIERLNVWR